MHPTPPGVTGLLHRRVQLLSIEGLLNGTQRAEHPDYEPDLNSRSQSGVAKCDGVHAR